MSRVISRHYPLPQPRKDLRPWRRRHRHRTPTPFRMRRRAYRQPPGVNIIPLNRINPGPLLFNLYPQQMYPATRRPPYYFSNRTAAETTDRGLSAGPYDLLTHHSSASLPQLQSRISYNGRASCDEELSSAPTTGQAVTHGHLTKTHGLISGRI